MKRFTVLALSALFVSTGALASDTAVPEFFYQPEEAKTAVEVGMDYVDLSDSSLNAATSTFNVSAIHGLTHGLALRVGVNYDMRWDDSDANGMNDFDLDIIGHKALGAMTLHYGVEGSVTPSKTGSQNFSTAHSFDPYLGVSMGEHCKYGAQVTYSSFSTEGGSNESGYLAAFYGEWDKEDRYLLGMALAYNALSSSDDAIMAMFYGRVYMKSFTLVPRLFYMHNLADAPADIDAYGAEIAARFMF